MSQGFEQKVLLVDRPIARDRVAAFADEHSLRCTVDDPWTNGTRHTVWEKDESRLTFATHALSGKGLLLVEEPADGNLAETTAGRFEAITPDEALQAACAATRPVDVVRAIHTMATLLLPTRYAADEPIAFLCRQLMDERQLIRWAASRILQWQVRPDVEKAYAEAAERFPELSAVRARVRDNCQAAEDGILDDGPTDSWYELVRRAREGIVDGKWKRVERATDMLLDDRLDHAEGLLLRGLAFEAAGDMIAALGLAGASESVQNTDRYVRGDDVDEDADALQAETGKVLARLRASVSSLDAETREASSGAVMSWLERFRDDERTNAHAGMARVLCDHLPSVEPLLCFVAGNYNRDIPLLERALAAAPGSPTCVAAMGHALRETDAQRAESLFRNALALTEASAEPSQDARRIESHVRERDIATKASLLDVLAHMTYERQDWDEAGKLADALVEADPDTSVGWQIRANARTFALRHEEAIPLYHEALEALDRILSDDGESVMFGDDPRPGMHFNLSCVLAKVGKREASLDHLRHAVRADDKYCEQAVEDDYYGDLLKDPEFIAIVNKEPRALVLEEELEREFVDRLASRALGLAHRGDVEEALEAAERAAQLAELGEHPDLLIRALSVHGRTLAIEGEPGPGLELLERAVRLADHEGIEDKLRAEATHTFGFVLHAAQQMARAEATYRKALALRQKAYGEGHPVVAKSYGDIARFVADQGRVEEARSMMAQGAELLARYLQDNPDDDDDERAEARVDLATLLANLAHMADHADETGEAIERLGQAVETLEKVFDEGYTAGDGFMEYASNLAERLVQNAQSGEQVEAARKLSGRLGQLGQSDDPEIRAEQAFWGQLRRFATRMKRQGVTDAVLAETFRNALRGADNLPEALRSVPELGGLANALAQRAARYPTFLIMAPMALETAAAGGSIDDALEQLEGLCVASLQEAP
jgi:tetratricopeptide (TPR) repeat protein